MESKINRLKKLLELSNDMRAPEPERILALETYKKLKELYNIETSEIEEVEKDFTIRCVNEFEKSMLKALLSEGFGIFDHYRISNHSKLLLQFSTKQSTFDLIWVEFDHYRKALSNVLKGTTMSFCNTQIPKNFEEENKRDWTDEELRKWLEENKEVYEAYLKANGWLSDADYSNKLRIE